MKKFYDRVREMTVLRDLQAQAYNDYSRFIVPKGRGVITEIPLWAGCRLLLPPYWYLHWQ